MNKMAAIAAPDSLELAGQLCSRLCHDLLNPIGALANGLELMAEESDPEMRQRCLALLEQSVRASSDKLRFFRLAFGGSNRSDEAVPLAEVRAAVDGLVVERGRVTVNWAVDGANWPRHVARALLNMALIASEALVRGGTMDVGAERHGDTAEVVVRAAGQRIVFDPAVGQALDGAVAGGELSARTVPAALLARLAAEQGGQVQWALDGDALVLGAVLRGCEAD